MACIIKATDKRSGLTYAYRSESYWDREKKAPRSRRTLIGRVDPETGEIVPTDGRRRKKMEETKPKELSQVVAETIKVDAAKKAPAGSVEFTAENLDSMLREIHRIEESLGGLISCMQRIREKSLHTEDKPAERGEVHVEYSVDEAVAAEKISSLRADVGWNRMERELSDPRLTSFLHVAAWDGEKLIGYVDSVSNGVTDAYIQDLMVHPDYQGKGIGTTLMENMIENLKARGIYMISVLYEERLREFYRRFGFQQILAGQMETYKGGEMA